MSGSANKPGEVGSVFTGPVHRLSVERVLAFSGGPFSRPNWPDRNLHTDLAKAQEAGLAGVIVSATQFQGFLIDLMIEVFGETWFTGGALETRVPKSLMLGDTLQAKATLQAIEGTGEARVFIMSISCENQNGEAVLTGTARCRVSANSLG